MPTWQRILATVVAMVAVSFVAGLIWNAILGFSLPSYLAGLIGGITAIPVWEFLRRVKPKDVV